MSKVYLQGPSGGIYCMSRAAASEGYEGYKRLGQVEGKHLHRLQAKESLRELFKRHPKGNLYAAVHRVSKDGASRAMSLYLVGGNKIMNITHDAHILLDCKPDRKKGMIVNGGGMDMVWHTACILYNLLEIKREIEVRTI